MESRFRNRSNQFRASSGYWGLKRDLIAETRQTDPQRQKNHQKPQTNILIRFKRQTNSKKIWGKSHKTLQFLHFAANEQKISTMVIFGKQIKLLPNLKFFGHLCLPGNPEALSQKSIWNCFWSTLSNWSKDYAVVYVTNLTAKIVHLGAA